MKNAELNRFFPSTFGFMLGPPTIAAIFLHSTAISSIAIKHLFIKSLNSKKSSGG